MKKMSITMIFMLVVFSGVSYAIAGEPDNRGLKSLSDKRQQERLITAKAKVYAAQQKENEGMYRVEASRLRLRAIKEVQAALQAGKEPDPVWVKIASGGLKALGDNRGAPGGPMSLNNGPSVDQHNFTPRMVKKTAGDDFPKTPQAVMVHRSKGQDSVLFLYHGRYILAKVGQDIDGTGFHFVDFNGNDALTLSKNGHQFQIGMDAIGSKYVPSEGDGSSKSQDNNAGSPQSAGLRPSGLASQPTSRPSGTYLGSMGVPGGR